MNYGTEFEQQCPVNRDRLVDGPAFTFIYTIPQTARASVSQLRKVMT